MPRIETRSPACQACAQPVKLSRRKFFLVGGFGPNLAVLRARSWLCAQGSLLMSLYLRTYGKRTFGRFRGVCPP